MEEKQKKSRPRKATKSSVPRKAKRAKRLVDQADELTAAKEASFNKRQKHLEAKKAKIVERSFGNFENVMPKCKECGKILLRCKCQERTLDK